MRQAAHEAANAASCVSGVRSTDASIDEMCIGLLKSHTKSMQEEER
jgi:hypothetical protein